MRCPYCGKWRHPGEGQQAQRGWRRHPAPALLSRLRRPLHHIRARSAARAAGVEAFGQARALRPRQAHALHSGRPAQAARRSRACRAHGFRHRPPARGSGRERSQVRDHRQARDGSAARLSTMSPMCALPPSTRISAKPRISRSFWASFPARRKTKADCREWPMAAMKAIAACS